MMFLVVAAYSAITDAVLPRRYAQRSGSQRRKPYLRKHARQHDVVAEIFARQVEGRAAVALVVAVDTLNRPEDLIHRREAKQPGAGRQDVAEAGLLCDHRPPGRQVGRAAV